jgi:hypothetical protein
VTAYAVISYDLGERKMKVNKVHRKKAGEYTLQALAGDKKVKVYITKNGTVKKPWHLEAFNAWRAGKMISSRNFKTKETAVAFCGRYIG